MKEKTKKVIREYIEEINDNYFILAALKKGNEKIKEGVFAEVEELMSNLSESERYEVIMLVCKILDEIEDKGCSKTFEKL